MSFLHSHDVAHAAYRMDERTVEATVNLVPEVTDIDVDNIGVTVKIQVPNVVGDLHSAHH